MPDKSLKPSADLSLSAETARSSLELLYEIGREVTADLDLRTLLHRVLFLAMKNVGAISGSIIVIDESGQPGESAFLMRGQTHDRTMLQLRVTYESGMAGWVARNRQAVLIPDTSKDERWLRRPDDAEERTGAKSAVGVPILAGDKLVGVITLVHPAPGFFIPEHLKLAQAIADWAGTAIFRTQIIESLQAANQRYRELFEDSIDPILITDRQGKILEANRQAEMTIGLSQEDLRSLKIGSLHEIDHEKLGPGFNNLASGKTVSYESTIHAYTFRDIPTQVYVRSVRYGGDSYLQWIMRDITERKDLDRLREDLIAMVYHDLRSPLSNVISSLEVLSNIFAEEKDPTVTSLLGIAIRSTDRIERLTNSLLDINRLEAGQTVGNRQPVNLKTLIDEVVTVVRPSAQGKEQSVAQQISSRLPKVFVDADMIRRVLINLLENAIKFTPVEGKIIVGAQRDGDSIQVSVKDNGPGIAAADQERIFEKFVRLNTKEGPRGLGLGLAYCRLAIDGHGGKIWVESEPGKGSTFKFILPVAKEQDV